MAGINEKYLIKWVICVVLFPQIQSFGSAVMICLMRMYTGMCCMLKGMGHLKIICLKEDDNSLDLITLLPSNWYPKTKLFF